MGWDGIGIQISFQSQRWPRPVPSQGVIKGQRKGGDPPAPFSPRLGILQRPHTKRPWVEGSELTFQGASRARQGPAALVHAGDQLGRERPAALELNFRPPPGADTSPPRPWEQLRKFGRNREALEVARKCGARTPTPSSSIGRSNPRQWKLNVFTLTSRS